MTNILEARGIFWWHGTPIPDGHFAPKEGVYGTIIITSDGRVSLDLDGTMPGRENLDRFFPQGESLLDERAIHGVLKGQSKHVHLQGLMGDGGGFSTGGIAYERYRASTCLVGPADISHAGSSPFFTRLIISLRGFENWTSLRSIEAIRNGESLSIGYAEPESLSFDVVGGKITIKHFVKAPWISDARPSKRNQISLEEQSEFIYEPSVSCSLDEMVSKFHLIGDLLNLLADTTYQLDWPFLKVDGDEDGLPYKLYLYRRANDAEAPGLADCFVLLPAIKDDFGTIFSKWIENRELYGPGYYLFLGTRRGVDLYVENHYVNLIWGIEALHRRQSTEAVSPRIDKRVQRILSEVSKNKDRKWLRGKLKYAADPTLEQRIFETFSKLPFSFSESELRLFAKSCADKRNDISHFGGQRSGDRYDDFVRDLYLKNRVLAYLIHAYILFDIGVPSEALEFWLFRGPKSYQINNLLKAVGLGSVASSPVHSEVQTQEAGGVLDQPRPQPEGNVAPE